MIDDPRVEKVIKIGEKNVPVWLYGNPKNPPIVFLHGYFRGFSDYVGDLPPRYLMKNYYVIAFDLPGFGRNKKLKLDSLEFIKRVAWLTIPQRKFTIFGVSYGGALGIRFCLSYPERVNALIIAGMPLYTGFYKIMFLLFYVPKIRSKFNFVSDFIFLNDENLSMIKVPVLLLYSKKDRFGTLGMGSQLEKTIKNAKLFQIYTRTHGFLLHRIDETGFLSEIEKFIDKVVS